MCPAASCCGPRCLSLSDLCAFPFKIYVHLKEGGGPDGLDALKNKPQLHGMVARSLCRNAAGKNYIIFTGPSITSLTLFEEFEKQGLSSGHPSVTSSLGKGWAVKRTGVVGSTDYTGVSAAPCRGSGELKVLVLGSSSRDYIGTELCQSSGHSCVCPLPCGSGHQRPGGKAPSRKSLESTRITHHH